ncbi:MAG: coproporphyrinogen III oxidase, partial [Planctomycetota bacterium]|nr:coproporphyrinogen III oxidase [Planctomycetota bacterium]
VRTDDDELRAAVIASLMCRFRLDRRAVEAEYDIDFATQFATELEELAELERDGLVTIDDDTIAVTDKGRLFVRNICMAFDAYLDKSRDRPVWSRTV